MSPEEKKLYYTLVAGLLVLTILMLMFAVSFTRLYRRRTSMLKEHLFSEISMVEEERKRIAADLHDGMGSSLAAINMRLKLIQQQHPQPDAIQAIFEHFETSSQQIRDIIHDLVPAVLSVKGLGAAIASLVEEIRATTTIKVFFELEASDAHFMVERTIILFRVVQEIIANALKHASATELIIMYSVTPKQLLLYISDNGKGFEQARMNAANIAGFGLKNIAARLMFLNASYRINTKNGEGTAYRIIVPLPSILPANENRRSN